MKNDSQEIPVKPPTRPPQQIIDRDKDTDQGRDSFRHDLRTQLGAIVSLTDLLRKTPDPEQSAPLLDALHLAADTAMAIVDTGAHLHLPQPDNSVSLTKLLSNFARLAQGLAQANGASFTLEIADALQANSKAAPDPVYLHRVLMLLLDNALKYGDRPAVTLTAVMTPDEDALLTFADNGPGFGTSDTNLLFEPYHRGPEPSLIAGTGLGLWSARNLVSMMNGEIVAEGNTPKGALFRITLPLIEADSSPGADTFQRPAMRQDRPATTGTHGTILIVDDNSTNHLILGEMLTAMGYLCLHAQSGSEALALLERERPDLALIDIRLGDMDGRSVARQIRSMEEDKGNRSNAGPLPLVALSSDPSPSHIAPFRRWLQRPVSPLSLYDCLEVELGDAE